MNEIASDTFSAIDPVVKDATFRMTPKLISRYPSVKNLRKLLKKYELMIPPNLSLADSHQRSNTYKVARANRHNNDPIRENIREAQFSRNSGDPIPLSKNLEL